MQGLYPYQLCSERIQLLILFHLSFRSICTQQNTFSCISLPRWNLQLENEQYLFIFLCNNQASFANRYFCVWNHSKFKHWKQHRFLLLKEGRYHL
jgi:hypothetical protein